MDEVEAREIQSLSFAHFDIMTPRTSSPDMMHIADLGQAVQETPTFGYPTEGASEVQSMRTLPSIWHDCDKGSVDVMDVDASTATNGTILVPPPNLTPMVQQAQQPMRAAPDSKSRICRSYHACPHGSCTNVNCEESGEAHSCNKCVITM